VLTLLRVLAWLWDMVAAVAFAPAVGRLGHDHYPAREAASRDLRAAGPLAWPALARGLASSPDPEVRLRCRRLLAPRDGLVADLAALWLLVGPEPDPPSLLGDEARRRRLAWWCWRLGVGTQVLPDGLPLPPADEVLYDEEWYDPPQALRHLRRLVRAGPPAR